MHTLSIFASLDFPFFFEAAQRDQGLGQHSHWHAFHLLSAVTVKKEVQITLYYSITNQYFTSQE